MTDRGYLARIFAIEWHGRLWLQNGVPFELCEAMVRYCSEIVDATYYGEVRPEPIGDALTRYWCERMRAYFDDLFASRNALVSFD